MLDTMSELQLIIGFFLFIFGTSVGSFLNVLIYRTRKNQPWMAGRSQCESCKKQIAWYDNIPLLSFIILRGKCRHCKKTLSISHPIVEGLAGTLFLWWYMVGFFFFQLSQQPFSMLQPLFWLLVGLVLLFIFIYDYRYLIIPDWTVIALTTMALLYRIALVLAGIMRPEDFYWTIFGAVAASGFFYAIWLLTKRRGIGFGDVKLAAPLGLLMGWPVVWIGLWLATVVGAVIGVALVATGKARFGKPIPFGPFLIIGTLLALVWGDTLISWYATLI
jgi:prepilin signal peptidase PulO-like enzyme (type II secretory pathway)